ncbi:MAG: hypothetical protein UY96_C0033G0005 [Parcubacteria group bacterium GW2011_GWB1_56_8]|nr:MAG: hypothetical protein UY96_C0033G0005 [Parcubacteria group bacterium GW2011_GWB1_56_8]
MVKRAPELAAVVPGNVLDLPVKEIVEPPQEVRGVPGALRGIHPGKGNLGMGIDAREDVALGASPVPDDGIEGHEEAGARLAPELGNALFGLVALAFLAQFLVLRRMEVEPVLLNHPLDLPGRECLAVRVPVEHLELLFAVAEMPSAQSKNAELLAAGHLPRARPERTAALLFQ